MIHARKDYNRIQDPALRDRSLLADENSTPIAEDEPVFLLRAKDEFFNEMLYHYRDYVRLNHPDKEKANNIIKSIEIHINLSNWWRSENYDKIKYPDSPKEE